MTSNFLPQHLGIILDGNRRWAREHGLPSIEGHRRGYVKAKQVGQWCLDRGIRILTLYAFSSENWQRPRREVSYLMGLFRQALERDLAEFHRLGIQLRVIGRISELAAGLQKIIGQAVGRTRRNTRAILNLAINYGGRFEIVDAVRRIIHGRVPAIQVTPTTFRGFLYAPDEPDPDLVIRTSGEQRLSGFLTWQSAYSELYFTKTHWPAFSQRTLDAALAEYARRQRRFGR